MCNRMKFLNLTNGTVVTVTISQKKYAHNNRSRTIYHMRVKGCIPMNQIKENARKNLSPAAIAQMARMPLSEFAKLR